MYEYLQGQINFHLTGGVQIFLRGVHWCATKELTGYDLVVSHTKLWLTVLQLAF